MFGFSFLHVTSLFSRFFPYSLRRYYCISISISCSFVRSYFLVILFILVSILPLSKADIPTLAQFLQESKLGLSINSLLFKEWPNYDAQRENYTDSVRAIFDNPFIERFKVGDNKSRLTVDHLILSLRKPRGFEVPGLRMKKVKRLRFRITSIRRCLRLWWRWLR